MKAKLFGLWFLSMGFVNVAFAATEEQKKLESAWPSIVAVVIFGSPLFYAGNKWKSWYRGFRHGSAGGGEFLSALLWTIGAIVWIIVGVFAWAFFRGSK